MRQKASYLTSAVALILLAVNFYAWATHAISAEATIFAQNLLWSMCALGIGVLYLIRRNGVNGQARWLMTGIAYVGIGTGIHRGYYTVWRWMRENDYQHVQGHMLDYAWLLSLPIGLALIGYAYHARPVLSRVSGDYWLTDFLSWTVILWSVAVWWLT